MADFVQNSTVKSAVRELTSPIPDVATFNTVVQSVITGNPVGCVSYISAGVTHDPVEKARENYTLRFVYQDPATAGTAGIGTPWFNTIAWFNAGITALPAVTALNTANAGTPVHDSENDSFSTTLRYHDPNDELYNLVFSRDRVTLQSYSDDAIRTKVKIWADTVPALA
jgi:hypothetical protein